ncbi:NAD(P)-dependent oxidoreductase [Polynucleobacter necessarius]|uniref:NAD(P)-dependent oxidoreductase n=1 Tax=Polynucleobacter necessarius TaxID=576610 RepID=UPI0018D54FDE|nr:NAD(P)-dependent oxidoreductase [Polynucleobacter necessarius]
MTPERAAAENAKAVSLDEFLKTSKVVSMHLVAGPGTKGLISSDQLALMRPNSILVNPSRSALINMGDLQTALAAGRPSQAAVDVFDIEPLPEKDALGNTPNPLVTPHLEFIAEPIFATFSKGITETLEAWVENKPVPHPFNPQ